MLDPSSNSSKRTGEIGASGGGWIFKKLEGNGEVIWKFRGCRVEKFLKGAGRRSGGRCSGGWYKKGGRKMARGRLQRMEEQCKPWNWTGCLQHLRLRGGCSAASYIELYTIGNGDWKEESSRSRVCTRNFYDKSRRWVLKHAKRARTSRTFYCNLIAIITTAHIQP